MSHKRERFISKGLLGFALSLSLCKHFYSSYALTLDKSDKSTIELDWFREDLLFDYKKGFEISSFVYGDIKVNSR